MAESDERSPLLEARPDNAVPPDLLTEGVPEQDSLVYRICHPTPRQRATGAIFLAIFLVELAVNSSMPAINSISETLVCRDLYGDTILDSGSLLGLRASEDPRCKASDVQQRLASLRGVMTSLECVPAIIFALPYGILADHIGRRPVIIMAWAGIALQLVWYLVAFGGTALGILPLWSVFFSAVWGCLGAFPAVGPAMVYTILADVTPQSERATAFFYVSSFFLMAEVVSNPLGGALLLWCGDFLSLVFSIVVILLSIGVLLKMPETLNFDQAHGRAVQSVVLSSEPAESTEDSSPAPPAPKTTRREQLAAVWAQSVHLLRTDVRATALLIFGNRPLVLLMIPFCLVLLGRFVQDLLLQFATKRYNWSWSQAAFLLTIRSTTNLLLCLVVLPFISELLVRRFRVHPLVKDLWIARVSGALLCAGALLIVFAVTPWMMSVALVVFSLGGGFSPVLRSLINAYVEPHHQAMLQTLLGLLELSGLLVAAPVLYGSLHRGLSLGGLWTGLPFMIAAGMIFVGLVIICIFRLPQAKLQRAEADEADDAEV